ncbi:hypothetical protein PAECIP111893_02424 [Paenibacillus plantiphilus]|uniref:Uncharacterized protein n=1 Tax=Paenibacillus plantiphilus TaxID=2905650 RepID=A0ABN8GFU2_9BACL|nr:hypothetical protein PAECIP111893_02424 [Paenibacillus plantiphilus]
MSIPCDRTIFLLLARLTQNRKLRIKYLSNYKRLLHRDWGWTNKKAAFADATV